MILISKNAGIGSITIKRTMILFLFLGEQSKSDSDLALLEAAANSATSATVESSLSANSTGKLEQSALTPYNRLPEEEVDIFELAKRSGVTSPSREEIKTEVYIDPSVSIEPVASPGQTGMSTQTFTAIMAGAGAALAGLLYLIFKKVKKIKKVNEEKSDFNELQTKADKLLSNISANDTPDLQAKIEFLKQSLKAVPFGEVGEAHKKLAVAAESFFKESLVVASDDTQDADKTKAFESLKASLKKSLNSIHQITNENIPPEDEEKLKAVVKLGISQVELELYLKKNAENQVDAKVREELLNKIKKHLPLNDDDYKVIPDRLKGEFKDKIGVHESLFNSNKDHLEAYEGLLAAKKRGVETEGTNKRSADPTTQKGSKVRRILGQARERVDVAKNKVKTFFSKKGK